MHTRIVKVALFLSLTGCGAAMTSASTTTTPVAATDVAPAVVAEATVPDLDAVFPEAVVSAEPVLVAEASGGEEAPLPAPPWADAPLSSREVPRALLGAWERAENRDRCAPLAPRSFGAAEGARARAAELEGGWSVEFDRPGMPGMERDGSTCEHCGRAVFGIAGTAMSPEELVDATREASGPAPSYADGSYAEIEIDGVEGESEVGAATITVAGEGCVYQVWSFLGPDHVEALVGELRRVEVPAPRAVASR